ncbi:hypothetical protein [Hoeflea sp.]|uniref:hypothetical protein n=1 Tax=Hoeflea sp. TaxID=1940281 RepID=UPI003B02019E
MANGSELALILEGGKDAQIRHSDNLREQMERIGLMEMSAVAAPALAAAVGSACAVVFYSSNHAEIGASIGDLAIILAWFFAAILLCVVVPGLSWLRQYLHANAVFEQKVDFEEPFIHDNARSRFLSQWGRLCMIASVVAIFGSYAALTAGGFAFLEIMR